MAYADPPYPGLADLLGARPGDVFVDLFAGSGGVARAWEVYESRATSGDASGAAQGDVSQEYSRDASRGAQSDASGLEPRRVAEGLHDASTSREARRVAPRRPNTTALHQEGTAR